MATGLVFYVVDSEDVNVLAQIGAGRRTRTLPVAAGEEYPAVVVRSPVPEAPGDATHADLLVFVDGTQPFFCRNRVAGAGADRTFNVAAQKAVVG